MHSWMERLVSLAFDGSDEFDVLMVTVNQCSRENGLRATENHSRRTKKKGKLSAQAQSRRDFRGMQCKSLNFPLGGGETYGISALSEYKQLTV